MFATMAARIITSGMPIKRNIEPSVHNCVMAKHCQMPKANAGRGWLMNCPARDLAGQHVSLRSAFGPMTATLHPD